MSSTSLDHYTLILYREQDPAQSQSQNRWGKPRIQQIQDALLALSFEWAHWSLPNRTDRYTCRVGSKLESVVFLVPHISKLPGQKKPDIN